MNGLNDSWERTKIHPISIIVPHFDKNAALNQVWDELQLQIDPEDEILIVDDHSQTKPEFDCPCSRTIQPPKVTPHTYRLCTLRNYGLQHANHDWCIILDPDCLPNPHFLKNARRMIDSSILFAGCIDKQQRDGSMVLDSRRNSGRSYWMDGRDKGGAGVWGGVMMFSRSRTRSVGWFGEEYNGRWGAEEHDFASKCYHSGMRLRYSMELQVTHLWHPKKTDGAEENKALWLKKREAYKNHLSTFTPYKPAVGVMVITMLRPELVNQCLQAVFRNKIPLKVRLVNNGDDDAETRKLCEEWGRRWAVDYVCHERKWPAVIRNESLKWAKDKGFKYLIFVDDDVTVINDGLTKLVQVAESHPEYVAVSGKIRIPERRPRLLGGPLRGNTFHKLSDRVGTYPSDWVGGGFTIHRLNPLLLYDEEYETGYNDYDWGMNARSRGYKLGVAGDAEAWHGAVFTSKGVKKHRNEKDYNVIRYDKERHERMNLRFKSKWGFYIKGGAKIVD